MLIPGTAALIAELPRMNATTTTDAKAIGKLRRARHALAGAGVAAAGALLSLLPRSAVVAAGRAAGSAAYPILRRERRIAHANLDVVFGDTMTRRRKRRIARGAFQTFGETVFGLLWAPRLSAGEINRWAYLSPQSEAHLIHARDAGRGFILAVPHYGDWELLSLALGFWGYPYMAVAANNGNRVVGSFFHRMRSLSGHVLVAPQYALLKMFKHLKRGGSIAMIADANVRLNRGGVWLDFFGLPVFNSHAAAELAIRCNAVILFGYVRPLPDGRSELVIEGEVERASLADHPKEVAETSQRVLDRCAAVIRADPEPWLWTYRRWRRRPTMERGRFPFYSRYSSPT